MFQTRMKVIRIGNPLVILLALPLVLAALVVLGVLMAAGALFGPLLLARRARPVDRADLADHPEGRRPAAGALAKDVIEAEFQRLPGQ